MRPALLALVALATTAHAAPSKPAHPDATGEELLALARAKIAERAGDLDKAAHQYRLALQVAKRASTYWNKADLERRMEEYRDAIKSFEAYKTLVTTDAERAAADAEIAAIQNLPMRYAISGHESEETYVFVDGVKRGPAPILAELTTAGRHTIDLISASAFDHWTFETKLGTVAHHRQRDQMGYGNKGGNVILAGSGVFSADRTWREGEWELRFPGRFTLPPGTYETTIGGDANFICNKLKLTVPKKGTLYVFVSAAARAPKGCTESKITTQVVPL